MMTGMARCWMGVGSMWPAALTPLRRSRGGPGADRRLALRTEIRGARALRDAADRRSAVEAGFARAVVDPQPIAVRPRFVPERAIHAERGPEPRDRLAQHRARLGGDRLPARERHRAGGRARID